MVENVYIYICIYLHIVAEVPQTTHKRLCYVQCFSSFRHSRSNNVSKYRRPNLSKNLEDDVGWAHIFFPYAHMHGYVRCLAGGAWVGGFLLCSHTNTSPMMRAPVTSFWKGSCTPQVYLLFGAVDHAWFFDPRGFSSCSAAWVEPFLQAKCEHCSAVEANLVRLPSCQPLRLDRALVTLEGSNVLKHDPREVHGFMNIYSFRRPPLHRGTI